MENSIFQKTPRLTTTLLLQDLVSKKQEFTEKVSLLTLDLADANKKLTQNDLKKKSFQLRLNQHNLVLVKESIAMLNVPINGIIYSKTEAESYRVTLNKLIEYYKKINSAKSISTYLDSELKKVKLEISQYQAKLNEYNSSTSINLELLSDPNN